MRAGSGLMKRVPADEFARHAAEYLEGTEPVSVEKDGEIIGRDVPVPNGHAANGNRASGSVATGSVISSEAELLREARKEDQSGIDLARIRRDRQGTMKAIQDARRDD